MQKLKGHCFTRKNCEIRCWLEVFCMLDIVKLKTIQYSTVANSVSNILVFSRRIYRTHSGLNSVEPLATQKQYIMEIMLLMVQIIKGHTVNAALILKKVWCYREAASIRFQTTVCWKDKSPKRHVGLFTKFSQKVEPQTEGGCRHHKVHRLLPVHFLPLGSG